MPCAARTWSQRPGRGPSGPDAVPAARTRSQRPGRGPSGPDAVPAARTRSQRPGRGPSGPDAVPAARTRSQRPGRGPSGPDTAPAARTRSQRPGRGPSGPDAVPAARTWSQRPGRGPSGPAGTVPSRAVCTEELQTADGCRVPHSSPGLFSVYRRRLSTAAAGMSAGAATARHDTPPKGRAVVAAGSDQPYRSATANGDPRCQMSCSGWPSHYDILQAKDNIIFHDMSFF